MEGESDLERQRKAAIAVKQFLTSLARLLPFVTRMPMLRTAAANLAKVSIPNFSPPAIFSGAKSIPPPSLSLPSPILTYSSRTRTGNMCCSKSPSTSFFQLTPTMRPAV